MEGIIRLVMAMAWEESILLVYLVSCHWLSVLGKKQKKKTTKRYRMMLIGIDRIRINTILSLWPLTKNYDGCHFYIMWMYGYI